MEKENEPANNSHSDEVADSLDEEAAAKEKLTGNDPKIKFTSISVADGKNGEPKVDIHAVPNSIGMDKDELMKYANEPFWVRLRMFLFILFWVGWVAMLVGAVIIILMAPRCPPAPRLEWYQKTAMYQVDVASFKDSDGDGIGDLQGLLSTLDYFSEIKVKTLLLNAIYPIAPNTMYGVLNHTDINSTLGTMADMDQFLAEAKKRDFKVILDFIPNQTSDKHPWYLASEKGNEPYKDFYVWDDGGRTEIFPNNWRTVNNYSAWHINLDRGQFYYYAYGAYEPDLNLRNELVQEELKSILTFWLDKGVDGFKVLGASYLFEDQDLKDEPFIDDVLLRGPVYDHLRHIYTVDQPENLILLAQWKDLLNNYSASTGTNKILMAELSGNTSVALEYYGNDSYVLVDFPINTQLTELNEESSPHDLKKTLDFWTMALQEFGWPNWMLGNRNTKRLADRIGPELIDGMHMVSILARGTPITYFGDELALTNSLNAEKTILMPWTDENTNTSFQDTNVEAQMLDGNSHLKVFSHVAELRNQPAISFGFQQYPVITDSIFSMIRVRKGSPGYLVLMNMGHNTTTVDLTKNSTVLPEKGRVEIRSRNIDSGKLVTGEHPKISLNSVPMGPKQAVVFSFVPVFED